MTERLEEAINNIEGIKTLTSTSREQVSNITIEFDLSRDIDMAAQDVRDRVARVRGRLPETIREPIIAKQEADANAIIWIAVNSERFTRLELSGIAERQIKNRLQTVAGVSSDHHRRRKAVRHAAVARLGQDGGARRDGAGRRPRAAPAERRAAQRPGREPRARDDHPDAGRAQDGRRVQPAGDPQRGRAASCGCGTSAWRGTGWRTSAPWPAPTAGPCVFLGIVKQSTANTVEVAHGVKRELDRPGVPVAGRHRGPDRL